MSNRLEPIYNILHREDRLDNPRDYGSFEGVEDEFPNFRFALADATFWNEQAKHRTLPKDIKDRGNRDK